MISTSFSTATLVQCYKQAVRKKSCYIHTRLISELSLLHTSVRARGHLKGARAIVHPASESNLQSHAN